MDNREWVGVHGAMMHRYVDGGRFRERALINDEQRAASTRVTSKALVCFHMNREVFKMVRLQARDKPNTWYAMENDVAKVACLLSHAPVFFSSARRM